MKKFILPRHRKNAFIQCKTIMNTVKFLSAIHIIILFQTLFKLHLKDKKRFEKANRDGTSGLNLSEFIAFEHPEEAEYMKVSFREYILCLFLKKPLYHFGNTFVLNAFGSMYIFFSSGYKAAFQLY